MRFLKKLIWSNKVDQISHLFAICAGICLLAMVSTISIAVVSRYIFGHAILGVNEFVQLAAVALVMLSLPFCTSQDGHVRVDIFDDILGPIGCFIGDVFSRTLCIITLAYLARKSWRKMFDALEYGDATNMLSLPLWPFFGFMTLGISLCVLVFIVQLLKIFFKSKANSHD